MYVAQETADSITYAYNRTNSDYDYLTLNQNKFYTWDVRDTNYYTVVLEDGTSLSAADMPENVSLLAENLSCGGGYNGNLWDTKLDGMETTNTGDLSVYLAHSADYEQITVSTVPAEKTE